MASDVTLELLDKDALEIIKCDEDISMDELLVKASDICHISPVARGLFAFRQVSFGLSNLAFFILHASTPTLVYRPFCLIDQELFC